jgi:hypothetical protein
MRPTVLVRESPGPQKFPTLVRSDLSNHLDTSVPQLVICASTVICGIGTCVNDLGHSSRNQCFSAGTSEPLVIAWLESDDDCGATHGGTCGCQCNNFGVRSTCSGVRTHRNHAAL